MMGRESLTRDFDPAQADNVSPKRCARFHFRSGRTIRPFGTLSIRRTWTNNTGAPVTRLRFRVAEVETFPAPSGTADLRPRTSGSGCSHADGWFDGYRAGHNSRTTAFATKWRWLQLFAFGDRRLARSHRLQPGGSINVQFLMGIQQTGCYKVGNLCGVVAEPAGGSDLFVVAGRTDGPNETCPGVPTPTPTPTPSPRPVRRRVTETIPTVMASRIRAILTTITTEYLMERITVA